MRGIIAAAARRRRTHVRGTGLEYMVRFSASEALYEHKLIPLDQPDQVELGPFPDYVELTYEFLRVGPDGDHIAAFANGLWVVGIDEHRQGIVVTPRPAVDGMRFSDVVVSARVGG